MEENISENNGTGMNRNVLIIGCLLFLCLILFVGVIIVTVIFRQQIPVVKDYFPVATATASPAPTSVPQILVHDPGSDVSVLKDDFSTNQNDWSTYFIESKVEVIDGQLAIESFLPGNIAIAECFCKSPEDLPVTELRYANSYYLQADVSTEKWTTKAYGLAFGLVKDTGFYAFTINANDQRFFLQKNIQTGWVKMASGPSTAIKPYPAVNTLSIYFDNGTIELFINGEKVATQVDESPIKNGKIGFTADDVGFKLLVDNLFVYGGD